MKDELKFTHDPFEFIESDQFMGLTLTPIQRSIVDDMLNTYEENGDSKYREAVIVSGMRSGKTFISSLIVLFLTHKLLSYDNPQRELGQQDNESLTSYIVSPTQACATSFHSISELVKTNKWWVKYSEKSKEVNDYDTVILSNKYICFNDKNIKILSINPGEMCDSVSYSIVFDEMSRMPITHSQEKYTAPFIYHTLWRRARCILHNSYPKVITTSSPVCENDFTMILFLECLDKEASSTRFSLIDSLCNKYNKKLFDPKRKGYWFSSFEMRPELKEQDFEHNSRENPKEYTRDLLAIPQEVSIDGIR